MQSNTTSAGVRCRVNGSAIGVQYHKPESLNACRARSASSSSTRSAVTLPGAELASRCGTATDKCGVIRRSSIQSAGHRPSKIGSSTNSTRQSRAHRVTRCCGRWKTKSHRRCDRQIRPSGAASVTQRSGVLNQAEAEACLPQYQLPVPTTTATGITGKRAMRLLDRIGLRAVQRIWYPHGAIRARGGRGGVVTGRGARDLLQRQLRRAIGVQQTIGFLVGVGELCVAKPAQQLE